MKLIITRHGETVDNVTKTIQGQSPGKLTDKGVEQAKKLGLSMKETHLDAIFSSDLKRASDTAAEIAKYHPDVPLTLLEGLRERDLRDYVGKSHLLIDWGNLPEDVESNEEMFSRVKRVIDEIYEKYPEKDVLVVCHGGVIKIMMTYFNNLEPSNFEEIENPGNTSVYVVEFHEGKDHIIHLLNNQDHLE